MIGTTCMLLCGSSCVCISRSGPRVRAGTRSSLRPLGSRGWRDQAKLGRFQPREREGVSVSRGACDKRDFVGWAKRSVPTGLSRIGQIVGTAQGRLCPPYGTDWESDAVASYSVIARSEATKQSRIPPRKDSGLLRCARNDGMERARASHYTLVPRTQRSGRAMRCVRGGALQSRGPSLHIVPCRPGSRLCASTPRGVAACPGTRGPLAPNQVSPSDHLLALQLLPFLV